MSQNRGEYSCLFTFKRDKHHLNSRTGQCRQNSIPNLIFRQKFPNFYPKQETKSINDYIQRHSFPFLIMPHSHMMEMRWSRDDFGRYLLKDTRETYIPFVINAIMTYELEWQATLQQNGWIYLGDEICWCHMSPIFEAKALSSPKRVHDMNHVIWYHILWPISYGSLSYESHDMIHLTCYSLDIVYPWSPIGRIK